MNDETDIDLKLLYGFGAENRVKLFDGRMKRYIGEILLEIDDPSVSNANKWIEKAIDADKCNGVMFELGMDYALYAKLFDREGDQTKAKENLGKAIAVFKECGADGWVEKYEKGLDALA